MLTVIAVELTNDVELRVIDVPERVTVELGWKPLPPMVRFWFVAPCPRELGVVEVTEGARFTAKHPAHVPD